MVDVKVEELRVILKSLLRTAKHGTMKLEELKTCFRLQEGHELILATGKLGFSKIEEMIKTWEEFEVYGHSLSTTVQCNDLDHIARMNKNAKKSGNNKKFFGISQYYKQQNNTNTRLLHGEDPYAFSVSEGESDKSLGIGDYPQYKDLFGTSRMLPSHKPIKSVDKMIPQPKSLEEIKVSGKVLIINVMDIANPHRFWFAEYSEYKLLDAIMSKMQEFYTKDGDVFKIAQNDVQENLYVAVCFLGLWHRGRVIKKLTPTMVRVFYVDFGTVNDVNLDKSIRYLMEEFADLPLITRRGVLSHVQPSKGVWSEKATSYFKKQVMNMKIEAKVFKINDRDLSYNLGMKTPGKESQLLTNVMISKGLCVCDNYFNDRDIVNNTEMEFGDYYESGKFLDVDAGALEKQDSWLPSPQMSVVSPKVTFGTRVSVFPPKVESPIKIILSPVKVIEDEDKEDVVDDPHHSIISSSFKCSPNFLTLNTASQVSSPLFVSSPQLSGFQISPFLTQSTSSVFRAQPSPRARLQFQQSVESLSGVTALTSSSSSFVPLRDIKNVSSISATCRPKKLEPLKEISKPAARQIVPQTFKNLEVGSLKQIYVHYIKDTQHFYFFVMSEFSSLRSFFSAFNSAYNSRSQLNEEFTLGTDVATYSDDNYCRGRIIEEIENGKLFKILLVDFGVTVERQTGNIFKLHDKWLTQQAGVYQGKLADASENVQFNSREKLYGKCKEQFVEAKITKIEGNVAEVLLLN